jgi:hypothetical protein
LKEIFNDVKEALDICEKMPAWEPHKLTETVATYEIPEKVKNQQQTQSITIDYTRATQS